MDSRRAMPLEPALAHSKATGEGTAKHGRWTLCFHLGTLADVIETHLIPLRPLSYGRGPEIVVLP